MIHNVAARPPLHPHTYANMIPKATYEVHYVTY